MMRITKMMSQTRCGFYISAEEYEKLMKLSIKKGHKYCTVQKVFLVKYSPIYRISYQQNSKTSTEYSTSEQQTHSLKVYWIHFL